MDRIARIKEMMVAQPGDSFLKHALALEYVKMGEDAAAKMLFKSVLENEPSYLGSYYQLGKLLERQNLEAEAVETYRKGMTIAASQGDQKTHAELRSALEEITE
ncbi:MAG: hypothetical protein H7Y27_16425 [Gemmatimonadaceae bacterium]|nr:hypothetical protein [Chitinophagaceae bacterium]